MDSSSSLNFKKSEIALLWDWPSIPSTSSIAKQDIEEPSFDKSVTTAAQSSIQNCKKRDREQIKHSESFSSDETSDDENLRVIKFVRQELTRQNTTLSSLIEERCISPNLLNKAPIKCPDSDQSTRSKAESDVGLNFDDLFA